jgi:UDP-N-acetylglucosamine acyltransferase
MSHGCQIHPTAQVDPAARIGSAVQIGPFAVITGQVTIGDGCRIESHAVITGRTVLGSHNHVGHAAILGGPPQHRQASADCGSLHIGDGNILREHCTVHCGLRAESETRIEDGCMLMVGVHVAHDCQLASDLTLANNVLLAGHVTVGRRAFLSGGVAVHQFCRIGTLAMVGGQAHIIQDVPPCVTVDGATSCAVGLNTIGLRRAGVDSQTVRRLKQAYRLVYRTAETRQDALSQLAEILSPDPTALDRLFYEFLITSQRGFVRDRHWSRRSFLKLVDPDPLDLSQPQSDAPTVAPDSGRLRQAS